MKHYRSMTHAALSARCDSYDDSMQMNDITDDSDDERPVTIFFRHIEVELEDENPDAWNTFGEAREVIGVVIGEDVPVILDRDQAYDVFGFDLVQRWECVL